MNKKLELSVKIEDIMSAYRYRSGHILSVLKASTKFSNKFKTLICFFIFPSLKLEKCFFIFPSLKLQNISSSFLFSVEQALPVLTS
jgi:hypothetical protein